ncbi:hypothetical protein AB0899_06445 [Streptomyces sp. NPDC007002]|uniref:hypothetical protein n=1 Tax=Streptomyces sp. NPDC007002 TaxID=3156910 RepID=UPI003455E18B
MSCATPIASGVSQNSAEGEALESQEFSVMRAASGETAVVDRSREGITAAAGKSFTELSWKGYAKEARYVVSRDDKVLARLDVGVTSFRDTNVNARADYHYQVAPVLPKGGTPQSRLWGMKASIPISGSATALREEAVSGAEAAGVAKTSTLSWISFIPQKKIDAPTAGCDYCKKFPVRRQRTFEVRLEVEQVPHGPARDSHMATPFTSGSTAVCRTTTSTSTTVRE